MKIAIVGVGLIGGSIAKDISSKKLASEIIGLDTNPENIDFAIQHGIITSAATSYKELNHADYIILAVPVSNIKNDICKILDSLHQDVTLMDVASCKSEIARVTNGFKRRGNYVSCHPISGTEYAGPQHALTNLFNGKINIICDRELTEEYHLNKALYLLSELGMKTVCMSSEEHDKHMAFISHLPHAIGFALANTIFNSDDCEKMLTLSGGGFKTSVRLAHSNAAMWRPIFEQNNNEIADAIDHFIDELIKIKTSLSNKNEMENLIKKANAVTAKLKELEKNKSNVL